jgi:hypothetical protein
MVHAAKTTIQFGLIRLNMVAGDSNYPPLCPTVIAESLLP